MSRVERLEIVGVAGNLEFACDDGIRRVAEVKRKQRVDRAERHGKRPSPMKRTE